MGAVGYGPFDNDEAYEALGAVRAAIEKKLVAWMSKRPHEDERTVAYVAMLVKLGLGPSSSEFGTKTAAQIMGNFDAPLPAGRVVFGLGRHKGPIRNSDTWTEPAKRRAVIDRVLRRWLAL